ncbi:E2F-associated phosphoprotein [Schistosoma japonicum]|nr:E2F-associated phosphoprotein [Schistosoma japonicum]
MFSANYDGCESDSSSSSDMRYEGISANITETSKAKALEFEELMDKELDLLVNSIYEKSTYANKENKQNKNLRVQFKTNDSYGIFYFLITVHFYLKGNLLVDEDPLCDYKEDEANSKWVRENLPGGQCTESDAILNCPGCMSVLSLNSHRQPHFKAQYYTEYPINCLVDETKITSRTVSRPKTKKSSVENSLIPSRTTMKEYHPVNCKVCGNPVGCKEVRTNVICFSNVLASHS